MLDSRQRGSRFEPHLRHCVVSLSKNINPSLVLVQPRKTCPFITERLLMGRKESNLTKYSETEVHNYLENATCDPLEYMMNNPILLYLYVLVNPSEYKGCIVFPISGVEHVY